MNVLEPELGLLAKLGSLVLHVDEGLDGNGDPLDIAAVRALLEDPEIVDWLAGMDELALLPVKR